MAGMPITIDGVICDLYGRTITGPVKIVGSVVRTDVGVGGGPIFPEPPPEGEKPPRPPLGIWPGPGDPDYPGPPDGGRPPDPPHQGKPPPPGGGWGWHPDYGWGYFPGSGGAGPHA